MSPVSSARRTLVGCQRLMLMPMARTSPSSFSFEAARCQRVVVRPRVAPDVKLLQVDRRHAEVLQAHLGVLADVVGRIHVVEGVLRERRPPPVLRAESWSRCRGACRRAVSAFARAAARCARRRTPTRCRRSCTRARPRDRATPATPRRRFPSTPPSPTCRSRLPRRPSRFRQKVCSASHESY